MIDYLAIGHLTQDLLVDGSVVPGGSAWYAAAVAARLGLRAAVLSAGDAHRLSLPEAGVALAMAPAAQRVTRFENRYTPAGRCQWLHTLAPTIVFNQAPPGWQHAPIMHLAPVANEFELATALAYATPATLVGLTPQGWMRNWAQPLPALVHTQPWQPAPTLLQRVGLLVLSLEDVGGDEALVAAYAAHCPLVALTRGAAGATLYLDGVPHPVAAFPAAELDPTGAGDVFAAALLVRLYEGAAPLAAAAFASVAAALSVEGQGLGQLTVRRAVEARMVGLSLV